MQTETVEVHSLQKRGEEWVLCIYQTPAVLRVVDLELVKALKEALDEGRSVVLSWEPKSGLVVGCQER